MKQHTYRQIKKELRYYPKTGLLKWLVPKQGRKKGIIPGTITTGGYRLICFDGVLYKVHRISWLLMKKRWPRREIDHKDGVPSNNRWKNLRKATSAQNKYNRRRNKTNTCGYKGVGWKADHKKFYARIRIEGRMTFLGYFFTPRLAHLAYKKQLCATMAHLLVFNTLDYVTF